MTGASGIGCAPSSGMGDVDRRKHDVDVIERVLGGVRDPAENAQPSTTRHFDIEVPSSDGSRHSTVELTVGLSFDTTAAPTRRR